MFARVPVCSTNIGFSVENTNLGFSVGYVLCASYVCTWYQPTDHSMVPGTYVKGYIQKMGLLKFGATSGVSLHDLVFSS